MRGQKIILIVLWLLGSCQLGFGQEWLLKLTPLETNISQLKTMFVEKPEKKGNDQLFYRLKEGNLIVDFSLGRCVETVAGSWDASEGTLLYVIFYPRKHVRPSHYDLPTEDLKIGIDHGNRTYTSKTLGIYYTVYSSKLTGVHLFPASKYDGAKCPS